MSKAWLVLGKLSKVRFFIGALIFGIIFSIAGGIIFYSQMNQSDMVETTATIVRITEKYESYDDTGTYETLIEYTDGEGQSHRVIIYEYYEGMKEGGEITIYYDPADPETVNTGGGYALPYIFFGIGIACVILGLVKGIKEIKTPIEEDNVFNKVDMSKANSFVVEEIENNDEETEEFYFHFTQKFLQGYIMEDRNRNPVFEAESKRFPLIVNYKFNFINHLKHREEIKICTHRVASYYGGGNMEVMTNSYFKINGVNCWKVLGDMGYSLEPHFEVTTVSFEVFKYGVKVGDFVMAGANTALNKNYKAGNIATNGVFKVHCKRSDIEGFFIACFNVSLAL